MASRRTRVWFAGAAVVAACVVTMRDAPCAIATAAGVHTRAHPVLIARGTLTLSGTQLVFTLEPSAHDLRHEGLDPTDVASWVTSAKSLAASIAVLDERGVRLAVSVVDATATSTRLSVDVSKDARFITLQLRPDDQSGVLSLNRQVHLEWTTPTGPEKPSDRPDGPPAPSRTLRLTTGGNAEIVDLRPPARDATIAPVEAPPDDALFSRVFLSFGYAHGEHDPSTRVVRCSVPVPLLQSWPDLAEPRADTLSIGDIKSLESRATTWLAAALRLESPEGVPIRATIEEARIVGPGAPAFSGAAAPNTPLNRWSARFTATIVAHEDDERHWLYAYWTAFNPAVATVDVLAGGPAGELRASRCGMRYPSRTSGLRWQPLPEGAMPTMPKP